MTRAGHDYWWHSVAVFFISLRRLVQSWRRGRAVTAVLSSRTAWYLARLVRGPLLFAVTRPDGGLDDRDNFRRPWSGSLGFRRRILAHPVGGGQSEPPLTAAFRVKSAARDGRSGRNLERPHPPAAAASAASAAAVSSH